MNRQTATMAQALVAADLNLAANIGLDLAAQVTLDLVVLVDVILELDQIVFGQILDAHVRVHTGCCKGLRRTSAANAVDVGERNLNPLLAGEVNARETCQFLSSCLFAEGVEHCHPGESRAGPRPSDRGIL